MRLLVMFVIVACGSAPPEPLHQPPPLRKPPVLPYNAPAISEFPQLGLRLPRHFTPTKYTARLAIDPKRPEFDGEIAIDGTLAEVTDYIALHGKHLDVTTAAARRGATTVSMRVESRGDVLVLRPAAPLDAGAWTIAITYRGHIDAEGFTGAFMQQLGGEPYITTQLESTFARLVFPCIDEPDRKVPWQLTLDVPKGQVALSNTPITATTTLDADHVRVAFAVTRPLPSYLVAFVVGPYEIADAGKTQSGVPLRVVAPHGTIAKAALVKEQLPRIVDFLETWFAVPYPYPKLDVVLVPSLRGNAMENAGLITCDAQYGLYTTPTAFERVTTAHWLGHETAHQWFGDLVTAAWWDDIWLNESFATWIEDKIVAAVEPGAPSGAAWLRTSAFQADALVSARRIRQPIVTDADIHAAFDGITYPKGALVLRMLEHELGEAPFQSAIRGYIASHADASARAADVFAALDGVAGKSLAPITQSFFDQAGVPEIAMTLACEHGRGTLQLAQRRYLPGRDEKRDEQWVVPVCVALEGAKHERVQRCVLLDKPSIELELDRCPAWFAPSGDEGYYRAKLDGKALDAIRTLAWPRLTPAERVAIYSDAWAFASDGTPIPTVMAIAAKLRGGTTLSEIASGLGDPTGFGIPTTTGLPARLADVLPAELVPRAEVMVRAVVDPLARKLGIVAKRSEDFAAQAIRTDVLSAARWSHSHVLDAEAKQLAAHLDTVPSLVRPLVLRLAAEADPATAAKLRETALAEQDPNQRNLVLDAVAGIGDPARHHAMLDALIADKRTAPLDLIHALNAGDTAASNDSRRYLIEHFDELVKRMPNSDDDFPLAANLVWMLVTCDAAERDRSAELMAKLGALPNVASEAKKATEAMDICVARRKAIEPSLRVWLGAKSR